MTELLEALYRGQNDRVDELLAQAPELNVFEAAALGKADRVRRLLDEDPSLANTFGDDGLNADRRQDCRVETSEACRGRFDSFRHRDRYAPVAPASPPVQE